jgi:hypothetical protein
MVLEFPKASVSVIVIVLIVVVDDAVAVVLRTIEEELTA